MMGAPDGTPAHWIAYFQVQDADAAASSAVAAGGTVLGEPYDSPYGRMVAINDPNGGTFFVIGVMAAA